MRDSRRKDDVRAKTAAALLLFSACALSRPVSSLSFSPPRHQFTVGNGVRRPSAADWKSMTNARTRSRNAPRATDDADGRVLRMADVPADNFVGNVGVDVSIANGTETAKINGRANGDSGGSSISHAQPPPTKQLSKFFPLVLWRFTRPHTLIGSALAIPSLFLLAAPTYASFFTKQTMGALLYAVVPALLMNLYITGLNQITDVEIDKINKPELPIANGDLKYSTAVIVVLLSAVASLAMSVAHPIFSTSGLQVALWGSFVLGTLYSLPPFRMKRHPLLAAFCIVAVRGTIINAGFYSHALSSAYFAADSGATVAGLGVIGCLLNDSKCALSSAFFAVFGIVIALMKDVPDAKGDRIFDIRSFTVRLGQKRVFRTMKNLLTVLFGVCGGGLLRWATTGSLPAVVARRGLVGLGCLIAGWSTNREARGVDPEDSGEVYRYYMHLWKLFYLSYLALPFLK